MARLPERGGDAFKWAPIIEEWLLVERNGDGTLKDVVRPDELVDFRAESDDAYPDRVTTEAAIARGIPETAGTAGQSVAVGPSGPVWVDGLLNIMEFSNGVGAGNPAIDTAAFEGTWTEAITERKGLYVPPGSFHYTGTGLTGNVYPAIFGAGSGTSIIHLGATSHLITPSALTGSLALRDLMVWGGYGAIRHTYTGTNVQGHHTVENCWFYEYTHAAISANAVDFPYWKIRNCQFWGADTLLTMGVALPGLTDNDSIVDCSFLKNRVHVKILGGGDSARIQNSGFIRFSTDRTNGPCTDIWIVPQSTVVNAGEGLVIRDTKFGNENLVAGDYRILIADELAGGTNDERWPNLTADSTGHVTGTSVENVYWSGKSAADDIPLLYSTTPNLAGMHIGPLVVSGVSADAHVVEYRTPSVTPDHNMSSSIVGPILSRFTATETEPAPKVSNGNGIAYVDDANHILRTRSDFPIVGPGTPANYTDLIGGTSVTAYTTGPGSSIVPSTDALGGTDAAVVTLAAATLSGVYTALASMTVGLPVWIEFDVLSDGATPLAAMQVFVRDPGADFHWRRVVEIPARWHTYRFAFTPRAAGAPPNIIFANPSGTDGTLRIGRVRVYHATEPTLPVGAANPDTSGATLAALEAGVNELKALLRSRGAMLT